MAESATEQLVRLKATRPAKGWAAQQQWDTANKSLIQILTDKAALENRGQGNALTDSEDVSKYLKGPDHKWFTEHTNEAALGTSAVSSIANTALGVIPGMKASLGTSGVGRAAILSPYLAEALYSGWLAHGKQIPDQKVDPRGADQAEYDQKMDAGWAVGSLIGGGKNALAYAGAPPKQQDGGTGGNGGGGSGGNSPPNGPSPIDLSGKNPKAASEAILDKLGISPGKNLTENRALIEQALKRASPDVLSDIAASHPSFEASDLAGSITKRLKYMRALSIPLAIGGVAAASLTPDEAEASVTGPLPRETSSLNPVPSRVERVTGALGRAASAVPGAAVETAPYLMPGLGQALTVRDMANTGDALYKPSRQYLDDADHMRPGRIGREVDRAQLMSNLQSAQAEDARQVAEMRARQAAEGPRQFGQNQQIDPASVPDDLRRFADPFSALPRRNLLLGDPAVDDRAQIDARQAAISRQYQARQEALASPTMPSTPTAQAEIPKEVLAKATNDGQPSLDARREDRVREALRGASEGAALPAETPQGIEHPPITSDAHFHQELAHIARFLRMKNGDVVRVEPQYQAAPPPPQMYSPAPVVPNRLIG